MILPLTLEKVLWILTSFIIWEILYVIFVKKDATDSWTGNKFLSFLFTSGFMMLQFVIVTDNLSDGGNFHPAHYDRLLIEGAIIVGFWIFFSLNKKLYNKLTRNKK